MPKPCLLIVDDEPDMVEFVGDVAEEMGFACSSASSAKECLDLFESINPAAIVLDVVMPDMDGIELLQALAKRNCTAPIIAMNGYQKMYLDILESLATEHNTVVVGTLSKPFPASELSRLLQQVLDALE
ncbi:MAG: response regulator [Rhodospirillales bacterium]|nr:response regulator [Rhodospirillales bacterium]